MRKLLFVLSCSICVAVFGQIPDGSIAPDFTLTDYVDGNSHNLYSYLNSGKTVFVEIFAAHCPSCWNYHQTNRLKNMYNMYGPDGTDEIMILALEYDQWNDSNAFIGNGPPWVTQGNWLSGTPYPIFDVEDPDRGVFVDYNVTFYPVVYKVCPDKIVERVSTFEVESQLYQKVQDCQGATSIDEIPDLGRVYIDRSSRSLIIDQPQEVRAVRIMNLQGQVIKTVDPVQHSSISLSELNTGIHLFEIRTDIRSVVRKLYVH